MSTSVTGKYGTISFKADDAAAISLDLADLGIRHHCAGARYGGGSTVVTACYDTEHQARKLVVYLVKRARREDKIAWQQDDAHREVEGWCELCEAANGGECHGGCLVDHGSGDASLPFRRFAAKAAE